MTHDTANLNLLWATLVMEELARCGIDTVSLSPGSRSSPLTAAAARHPKLGTVIHYDERGAAFFALGHGRAAGRPAAWITTSGTAAANGYPAVIEASRDGVPMLIMTADRPPELQETGANQTIDQHRLFGTFTRWFHGLPCPDPAIPPETLLTTVDQAVYRSLRPECGPVHLNLMFREPLLPEGKEGVRTRYPESLRRWARGESPFTRHETPAIRCDESAILEAGEELSRARRGIMIVGKLRGEDEPRAVAALANRLGWPVFPDITSGLRLSGILESGVPCYDQVLSSAEFRESHRPAMVLHLGGRFVSKRLLAFLKESRPPAYLMVRPGPERIDPAHRVTHRIEHDIPDFCRRLAERIRPTPDREWLARWKSASAVVERRVATTLARTEEITEPGVAVAVTRLIPEGHLLAAASSMPVRDLDMFGFGEGPPVPVIANRGASGIDGTVATMAGASHGAGRPATLLVGDLALLHDLNSLPLVTRAHRPATIVVINNDGGGIFEFLPVSRHRDIFEDHFAAPHGCRFDGISATFGLDYRRPSTMKDFEEAYRDALRGRRDTLIEVRTERGKNRQLHTQFQEALGPDLKSLGAGGG